MNYHSTEAIAPDFEFNVVSSHRDPLSRQVKEAVLISNKGKLNKKKEFAINEILRMEAGNYSWEMDQEHHNSRIKEQTLESNIRNFINVMSNVKYNCDNKYELMTAPNKKPVSRYKNPKRTARDCTQTQLGQQEIVLRHFKKQRVMETSTPVCYRQQQQILADESPISSEANSISTSGEISDVCDESHTGLSGNAEHLQLDKLAPEPKVQEIARQIVTANNHFEASDAYVTRMNMGRCGDVDISEIIDAKKQVVDDHEHVDGVDISNWEKEDKFKKNDSDTRSVDQEDVSEVKCQKFNSDDQDLGLVDLFREGDDDDDFGLADLFLEEEVCEAELDRILRRKNRNSLYDAFDKDTFVRNGTIVCTTPVKRKLSPSNQTPGGRFNKLSMKLYNSPELRQQSIITYMDEGTPRRRNTAFGVDRKSKAKTYGRRRIASVGSKVKTTGNTQQLLQDLWKKAGLDMSKQARN